MTANLRRPRTTLPYDRLPEVPSFTLTSPDLVEGQRVPEHLTANGGNTSPELSWSGAPQGTRSFAVTCFDPDAPTPSGYWHWTVVDLDADATGLPADAGQSDLQLDGAAFHVRNDAGTHAWFGPCPPAGDGEHRYVLAVHALDVDTLEVDDEATPGGVAFNIALHTLGRALLTVTYSTPGPAGDEPFIQDRP